MAWTNTGDAQVSTTRLACCSCHEAGVYVLFIHSIDICSMAEQEGHHVLLLFTCSRAGQSLLILEFSTRSHVERQTEMDQKFVIPAAHSRGGPALLVAFTSAPSVMRSSMAGTLPAGAALRCGLKGLSQQYSRTVA